MFMNKNVIDYVDTTLGFLSLWDVIELRKLSYINIMPSINSEQMCFKIILGIKLW
jgi:hypothetical protein